MRTIHRAVIVTAFFLMLPIFAVVTHETYQVPTIAEFVQAYAIAFVIVAAIVYPIGWVFSGTR
jgi:hypothetical protein